MARTALVALLIGGPGAGGAEGCGEQGVAVQMLGSGGPVADDARAGSGYLVWQQGRARVLVDLGGGAWLRFGEAGARIADLRHVALTHYHADHVADLPAFVKGGYFSARTRPLTLSGPTGGGPYPSLTALLERLFSAELGAFAYLAGALDGSGGQFRLVPQEIDPDADRTHVVVDDEDLTVTAVGVDHGPVPALAYLVEIGGVRIGFGGDQDGRRQAFWRLLRNADLLVAHLAVPERATGAARRLHAVPSVLAVQAEKAAVRQMVLSHLMQRSLETLADSRTILAERYTGRVEVAEDLSCFAVSPERPARRRSDHAP